MSLSSQSSTPDLFAYLESQSIKTFINLWEKHNKNNDLDPHIIHQTWKQFYEEMTSLSSLKYDPAVTQALNFFEATILIAEYAHSIIDSQPNDLRSIDVYHFTDQTKYYLSDFGAESSASSEIKAIAIGYCEELHEIQQSLNERATGQIMREFLSNTALDHLLNDSPKYEKWAKEIHEKHAAKGFGLDHPIGAVVVFANTLTMLTPHMHKAIEGKGDQFNALLEVYKADWTQNPTIDPKLAKTAQHCLEKCDIHVRKEIAIGSLLDRFKEQTLETLGQNAEEHRMFLSEQREKTVDLPAESREPFIHQLLLFEAALDAVDAFTHVENNPDRYNRALNVLCAPLQNTKSSVDTRIKGAIFRFDVAFQLAEIERDPPFYHPVDNVQIADATVRFVHTPTTAPLGTVKFNFQQDFIDDLKGICDEQALQAAIFKPLADAIRAESTEAINSPITPQATPNRSKQERELAYSLELLVDGIVTLSEAFKEEALHFKAMKPLITHAAKQTIAMMGQDAALGFADSLCPSTPSASLYIDSATSTHLPTLPDRGGSLLM